MSTTSQRIATLLLVGATALAPASTAIASESSTAYSHAFSAPPQVTAGSPTIVLDALTIARIIFFEVQEQIKIDANRSGLVRSLRERAWFESKQKYNVAVLVAPKDNKNRFTTQLNGKVLDAFYDYENYPRFRLVAFKSGKIVNNGDGGYINWAFRGVFTRKGNTVNFR